MHESFLELVLDTSRGWRIPDGARSSKITADGAAVKQTLPADFRGHIRSHRGYWGRTGGAGDWLVKQALC